MAYIENHILAIQPKIKSINDTMLRFDRYKQHTIFVYDRFQLHAVAYSFHEILPIVIHVNNG